MGCVAMSSLAIRWWRGLLLSCIAAMAARLALHTGLLGSLQHLLQCLGRDGCAVLSLVGSFHFPGVAHANNHVYTEFAQELCGVATERSFTGGVSGFVHRCLRSHLHPA